MRGLSSNSYMKTVRTFLVIGIALVGTAASLMIQNRAESQLAANDAVLQQHENELHALLLEQRRLSNSLAQTKVSLPADRINEIRKLQNEAEALHKQTNELAQQRQQLASSPTAVSAPSQPPRLYPQEYYVELNRLTAGKTKDAKAIVYAFGWFARENDGAIPSTIDLARLDPYLRKGNMSLTGTNEFEVVYHGSLHELSNVPPQAVALIRERQPWLAPSGKWARVYGMVANSMPQVIESDDNFQSWEAEHIVPPSDRR
jgi:hypothetical protein